MLLERTYFGLARLLLPLTEEITLVPTPLVPNGSKTVSFQNVAV